MIFMTALAAGFAAGLTRSALSIALTAAAIPALFALSCLLTASLPLGMLLSSVAGYNAGLIALLAAYAALPQAPGKPR